MRWALIILVLIILGVGIIAIVPSHFGITICQAQVGPRGIDYCAPAEQASAPVVAWIRSIDPGFGGSLITDNAGDLYLWYDTGAHVLKYDLQGKVIWNKRFVPAGQNGWTSITSNPKGELFMSRKIGEDTILSRLLPKGTLAGDVHLPMGKDLVSGPFAVDASGSRAAIDFIPKGSEAFVGQQYLSKYSPNGKREWTTYLRDVSLDLNNLNTCNTPSNLDPATDTRGNSYILLGDITGNGIASGKLMKFKPDGKQTWDAQVSSASDTITVMRLNPTGNIYMTGQHNGLGYYISKYDPSGKQRWIRQPQSATGDLAEKLAADKSGDTYIAGSRPAASQNSKSVVFVAKHDASGRLVWRKELPKITMLTGMAVDSNGIYVSGAVQGNGEMYLMKLDK